MSGSKVGVAILAAVIGVGAAGAAHAQATPGPRPAPRPTPTDPSDTWDKHTSLGLELGPGGVLTSYDFNQSPSALLFYGSVRGSIDLTPAWSGGLTLRQWWLPNSNHGTMLGATARFEPATYEFGRVFADVAIGPTTTKTAWAFGFDIGGGIEWNIPDAPGLGIGPYIRYNQIVNPDSATDNDGRAWSLGGSFSYHFGRAAEATHTEGGGRRGTGPYRLSVPDSDHDGVGDDVPDADDACPVTPPGPTPDPKRPGCPLVDTDKDGIPDPEDACPLKPGPATADPANTGCPVDKRRSAAPAEGAPPPSEPASEPSTVKKRQMKQ